MLEIIGIIGGFLGGLCGENIAAVHLRPAGNTRANLIHIIRFASVIQFILVRLRRTIAYQAHLSEEDIIKLGEFVDRPFTDKCADFRYVSGNLCIFITCDIRASLCGHATKFDTVEEFSIFSYSLLLEEYRTRRINFDCDGDNDKNGD